MKKLLGIIVLSLLLVSCSSKPEKIIENCADKEHDFLPDTKVLAQKFEKNRKFVKLRKLRQEYTLNKNKAERAFKRFALREFNLSKDDMRETTNILTINVLKSNDNNYEPEKFPRFIFENKVRNVNKKDISLDKIEKLFYAYQESDIVERNLFEKYWSHISDTFYKFKLKDKLKDGKYEKYFKRCEARRERSPLAFDAKWK